MNTMRIAVAGVVLAILAVVGYASIVRNADEAKKIAGARNLQQWGIALNLYLIDNGNQLPEVGSLPVTAEEPLAWFNALPPYISQKPLADLPPGQRPRPGIPSLWIEPASRPVRAWDPEVFYFNYAMNRALQPDPALRSFRIYEIPHPGNVIFMSEVDGYAPGLDPPDVVFRRGSSNPVANVLFCDGHVQGVPKQVLVGDPHTLRAENASEGISWFKE
jgi:prepilin-type processing-associated H-X9-DG protein